jgi:hypothetical protein
MKTTEQQLLDIVSNCRAKALYQVYREQWGVARARREIALMFNSTEAAVKEAAQYWA